MPFRSTSMKKQLRATPRPAVPRQLAMSLDPAALQELTPAERRLVVTRLTRLLLEAAGIPTAEHADDGR